MPVVVVVVVDVVVVIGRCRFRHVFSQSYHDGQLSLLRSISGLPLLSEHRVLSSISKKQWQERIILMKVCILLKIKPHIPSIAVHTFRLSIRLTTSQGAKYFKIRLHNFPARKGVTIS